MNESPEPCQRRPHTEPDRHSIEFARAATSADLLVSAMWPYLPLCAARAISMTLLLVMAVGVFATFSRGAHAQSTEVLISNGEPPPSARLLLVNLTQRHVAQEFTTGPHPAGYDVYAVAEANVGAAIRPSRRTGAMAVPYAPANHMYAVPVGGEGRERAETTLARMSPCLRLSLSEPVSRWDTRRCDDG